MAEPGFFDFINRATMNPLFMGGLGLLGGGGGPGAMQGMQQGLMAQRQMTQDQELAQRKAAFQQAVQSGLFKDMPGGMGALAPLMTPEQAIGLAGDFGKAKYGSDLNISERRQILPLEEAMKQRMLAAQGSQELRNTQALTAWRAQNDPLYRAQVNQANQKDEMNSVVAGMLRGIVPQQPAMPPAQNPIRPQSMDGGPIDPNIIQTQTAAPQAPVVPSEPMAQTPFGMMPQSQARALGGALAMSGKGDAGKMFVDAANAQALGKEGTNEVDKKYIAATESLGSLRNIRTSFDPDMLKYKTQAGMWGASLAAKAGTLDKASQEKLYKFATFRRDAAANINAAIKANSGATVTDQEMKRNLAELPNAGSGIFDGDDPVSFKAKLDRAEETIALGVARLNHLKARGFSGDANEAAKQIPLETMRGVINNRAKQIEADVRKQMPGADKAMLDRQVDLMVKKEFGI